MKYVHKTYIQDNLNIFYTGFVKLVLEVFGASGAVWGFSEVLTLRNPDTVEFWRVISIGIAAIFMIRYLVVMFLFIRNIAEKRQLELSTTQEVK